MPGPLCSARLGEDWLDAGTLALTRHTSKTLARSTPRQTLGFTIAYADKNGSFSKAAMTWRAAQNQDRFFHHRFNTIDDLARVFRQLAQQAKEAYCDFSCGAMFIHSSPLAGDAQQATGGLHAAPFRARTLAEQRYRDEVLVRDGLEVDSAGVALLKTLRLLPWARGATLWVTGCLSGGTPSDRRSVAEALAAAQKVRTVGETGKAYFSSNPDHHVPITTDTQKVYLRAFHIKTNLLIEASEGDLSGLLNLGQAMPQRTFNPP